MSPTSDPPPSAPGPDPRLVALLATAKPTGKQWWMKRVVPFVLLAVIAGSFAWWKRRTAEPGPKWVTAEVKRADIRVTVTATGTLSGVKTVEVGSEVSGKVIELRADFNERVRRGDVLAVLDSQTSRAAVDQAAAQLTEANAAIRTAKATLQETRQTRSRAEEQARLGLVSQRDLEAARAAAERAEAQVASAEAAAVVAAANLSSARSRLEKTTIVSPIDGVVLARLVELGQTVTAGFQTPVLFKVTEDLTRMQLTAYIDEADVGRAKEGQRATFTVDAYPSRRFEAAVLSVRNEPRTEQNVVSYESILSVDNSALDLRPGMTATATIEAETHNRVLTVPSAALRFNPTSSTPPRRRGLFGSSSSDRNPRSDIPKEPHVWLLVDGKPQLAVVTVGASDGIVTEVTGDAVTEGAVVIVDMEGTK